MVEIDAKGLSCPQPLMMVQAAMKSNPGESIRVEVSDATPRDNIARLARRKKRSCQIEDIAGGYVLTIE